MPTLAELQAADAAHGKAQLQTLLLEFSATLTRLPNLQRELQSWLSQDAHTVDYAALSARAESALVAAADWLLDYDHLPTEIRQAQAMQDFMRSAGESATCRTVAGLVHSFDQAKELAAKQQKETDRTIKRITETLRILEDKAKNEMRKTDTKEIVSDFIEKIDDAAKIIVELHGVSEIISEIREAVKTTTPLELFLLKTAFLATTDAGTKLAITAKLFALHHQKFFVGIIEQDDGKIFFGKMDKGTKESIKATIQYIEFKNKVFDAKVSIFASFNKMVDGFVNEAEQYGQAGR